MSLQGPVRPRASIKDVADAAGMSISTVSLALRDRPGVRPATRQRILALAEALNYQPDERARFLRQQRTRLVGVVFELDQGFHQQVVDGLYVAAKQVGYNLVLSAVNSTRSEQDAVKLLLADRCEGLVLIGPKTPAARLKELAAAMPTVVVGRSGDPDVDTVNSDEYAAMSLAVQHLVDLGHSRIAYADGRREPLAASRRRAFKRVMKERGLDAQATVVSGGSTESEGAETADAILADPNPPTALCCFNDLLAVGTLLALRDRGVAVPEELSIVGYDDQRLASIRGIALTTIRQSPSGLASAALTRLVDRVEGRGATDRLQQLAVELVERRTTGVPRAAARA
nr:LacI family DNA-binding transcriptional regulator [Propionicimonas sp.]